MEHLPLYIMVIQSFFETLILIFLGLALSGYKPASGKIILTAMILTIASYFIRMLPIPGGFNVLIQLPLLILLLILYCKIPLRTALLSSILGFLLVSFTEALFMAFITWLTGISILEALSQPAWRILYPLPEFILLTLLILYLRKREKNIFNLFRLNIDLYEIRINSTLLLLLGLSVLLVVIGFYCQMALEHRQTDFSSSSILTVLMVVIMLAVILSLALSWKLFFINKQQRQVELQQFHISNLQEMMQIIKAQRHDFVNHLQVIYGFVCLGQKDQTETYINTLYHDVKATGDLLEFSIPELSALLLVKSGMATARNISLEVVKETNLSALTVPPLELVTVVGNLLNNALEAVEMLEPDARKVKLKIYEKSRYYVIQTQNPGWISPDHRKRLFELGYSSKTGDRGIGLASVKYQVEKQKGLVLVSSHQQSGTRFTVCYPRRKLV